MAKAISRRFDEQTRPDWDNVRVKIMRWCLRVKLVQNRDTFGSLLLSTTDLPLVEYTKKDVFWGARPAAEGRLVGRNVLGRLLMELRDALNNRPAELAAVSPVPIPNFTLLSQPITSVTVIGKKEPTIGDIFG